ILEIHASKSFRQRSCIFVPEHLRLQAVWVTEEHTHLGAEVRNGAIQRPQLYQAYTDVFEGLPTVGIQTKMVYASTPKHWGLDTRLGIARHLEHIELTLAADGHDYHAFACMTSVVPIVMRNFGIKRLLIK